MITDERILIVEDDPVIALDLSRIITSAGMKVIGVAATTPAARHLATESTIDAAVLDVRLELGDTLDFARELRVRKIPFLFQTSDPRLVVGLSPPPIVLAKPFRPKTLIEALRGLLSLSF